MICIRNSVTQTELCQTEPKESITIDPNFSTSSKDDSEFKNFVNLNMDLNSQGTS